MTKFSSLLYINCFLAAIGASFAFHTQWKSRPQDDFLKSRLFSYPNHYNYNNNNNGDGTNDITKHTFDIPMAGFWENIDVHKQLKDRRMAIHDGVGKRYIVRTGQFCLNVHLEPCSALATDNIVNQLTDGQIVRSTGPTRGIWIPHDGGGWSVSDYQGHTLLEPIDE